jgi:predicted flap endonuclease-1-like 5' DNA nuclease
MRAVFLICCIATFSGVAMNNTTSPGMERQKMTWLDGFSDPKTARERAETAFYAPLGMMSPLWIAFGAAASAGAAFWLMTRLAKPVNIEAEMAVSPKAAFIDVSPPTPADDDATVEAASTSPFEEPSIEPAVVELAEVESAIADDLTELVGVGPKIAQALAERGVERFEQLAAWTEQDLAAFDEALNLRGRAIRAGFVDQARRLAAGGA